MKRTVKKAVVIGLSTVMVVAGSVFAYCSLYYFQQLYFLYLFRK